MSAMRSLPPAELLAFLEGHAGLVFPAGRLADVDRAARKTMARSGVRDMKALLARLQGDDALLGELLAELVVGETYFFREPHQLDALRKIVLPDLTRSRADGVPLRIWSAGCATGEEAYSLAILFEQEGLGARGDIVATDICEAALNKARRATYEHWSFRGAKDDFTRNYFRTRGGKHHLIERIRDKVSFESANLASETYPKPRRGNGFDLILCRNVLIYFGAATVKDVARRLYESLDDGGWLVTAPSDPPLWDAAPFETHMTAGGVFYRKKTVPAVKPKPANVIPFRPKAVAAHRAVHKAPLRAVKTPEPDFRHSATLCEAHAQALFADNRSSTVLDFLARAVVWHPLSRELHYLYAVGLLNRHNIEKAAHIARRLIYLDPRSVAAYMLLGTIAQQRGDHAGAMRAYRNGLSHCGGAGEDEIVPLTGNERYGRVAAALAAEIATLQSAEASR